MAGLTALIAFLGAPVLTAIAGVTLAIVGIIAIIKEWEDIVATFNNLWQNIFNALPQPVQKAWNAIKGIFDKIKEALDNIGGKTLRVLASIAVPGLAPFLLGEPAPVTGPRGTEVINPADIRTAVSEGVQDAFTRSTLPLNIRILGEGGTQREARLGIDTNPGGT